jgi:hypothetical protein
MSYPIFYYEVEIAYRKNKQTLTKKTWVVSKHESASDVMTKDYKDDGQTQRRAVRRQV